MEKVSVNTPINMEMRDRAAAGSNPVNVGLSTSSPINDNGKMSLMDKYKNHYQGIRRNPCSADRLGRISPIWYMITICGVAYYGTQNILPILYEGKPNAIFYLQCLTCFIFFEMMSNWLCIQFVDTSLNLGIGNNTVHPFDLTNGQINTADFSDQGKQEYLVKVPLSAQDKKHFATYPYWSWKPCIVCQAQKPARTHHCPICKKCILKRDHHCFFTNSCVGLRNQRYFTVFNFWAGLGTAYFLLHYTVYLLLYLLPELSYFDLFYPFAIIRCFFGYISFYQHLFVFLLYSLAWFCPVSISFFLEQVRLIKAGVTSFEADNKMKVASTASLEENIRGVFGNYWLISFLFPCHWLFPNHDTGLNWNKIKE